MFMLFCLIKDLRSQCVSTCVCECVFMLLHEWGGLQRGRGRKGLEVCACGGMDARVRPQRQGCVHVCAREHQTIPNTLAFSQGQPGLTASRIPQQK